MPDYTKALTRARHIAPAAAETARIDPRLRPERDRLSGSFREFVKAFWPILEPKRPLVWGWHIDCLFAHMEAVLRGEIRVLVINLPPGHFKSSSIGVIFPAWAWTQRPEMKFLTGSYALNPVALRDARKARRIIESDLYQSLWPEIQLASDQNAKGNYVNSLGGARYCFGTKSGITGEHGHMWLWDDPLRAADAYSDVRRREAVEFMTETLPSRLLPTVEVTGILMQQRLHEGDPSGFLLKEAAEEGDDDVVHVCLPLHFDPERRCDTRWFRDPRKEKGDLLWPEMFDERKIRQRYKLLSDRAQAAQLEQQPSTPGGAIIKRKDWRVWSQSKLPAFERILISFDPAMKDGDDTSYWACQVWGCFVPSRAWDTSQGLPVGELADSESAMLIGAWRKRCGYVEAKRLLLESVAEWTLEGVGPDWVLIEDKAGGIHLVEELERASLPGLVPWNPGTKSKTERAELASDVWAAERVWVPGRKLGDGTRSASKWEGWVEEVVDECAMFPNADNDDYLDAASMAINFLRQEVGLRVSTDEEPDDSPYVPYEKPKMPLYG